jgi:hypothetical protein
MNISFPLYNGLRSAYQYNDLQLNTPQHVDRLRVYQKTRVPIAQCYQNNTSTPAAKQKFHNIKKKGYLRMIQKETNRVSTSQDHYYYIYDPEMTAHEFYSSSVDIKRRAYLGRLEEAYFCLTEFSSFKCYTMCYTLLAINKVVDDSTLNCDIGNIIKSFLFDTPHTRMQKLGVVDHDATNTCSCTNVKVRELETERREIRQAIKRAENIEKDEKRLQKIREKEEEERLQKKEEYEIERRRQVDFEKRMKEKRYYTSSFEDPICEYVQERDRYHQQLARESKQSAPFDHLEREPFECLERRWLEQLERERLIQLERKQLEQVERERFEREWFGHIFKC